MIQDILYGRKTILFPLRPEDLEDFVKVHRQDKNGYMCRFSLRELNKEQALKYVTALLTVGSIAVWVVSTKEGKKARRVGYIYLSNVTSFSGSISGIMDIAFTKGLAKEIRKGKYTYTQDAFTALIDYCFKDLKFQRIATDIVENNRRAIKLCESMGFMREGKLRQAIKIGKGFKNLLLYSLLNKEWDNG